MDSQNIEDVAYFMNAPPHPADFLNEVLMPATGRSDGEIARLLGISLPVFYTILTREKPISPATAAMLGRLFNTGEDFWLTMQAEYDRFTAPQRVVDGTQASPRSSSLAPNVALQFLPKVSGGSDAAGTDKTISEFDARDVISWARSPRGNDRSSVG